MCLNKSRSSKTKGREPPEVLALVKTYPQDEQSFGAVKVCSASPPLLRQQAEQLDVDKGFIFIVQEINGLDEIFPPPLLYNLWTKRVTWQLLDRTLQSRQL